MIMADLCSVAIGAGGGKAPSELKKSMSECFELD